MLWMDEPVEGDHSPSLHGLAPESGARVASLRCLILPPRPRSLYTRNVVLGPDKSRANKTGQLDVLITLSFGGFFDRFAVNPSPAVPGAEVQSICAVAVIHRGASCRRGRRPASINDQCLRHRSEQCRFSRADHTGQERLDGCQQGLPSFLAPKPIAEYG